MSAAAADPLFDRDGWWDPACRDFAALRSVGSFRLELLRHWLPLGLKDRTVVDLGCGGGLLAVPLARAGARVIGVDLARTALRAGRAESARSWQPIVGELTAVPVADRAAELVLLADVLEHVDDPAAVVLEAARLLCRGGHLFVNTIHRTWRSRLFAITLGEGLGFIPRGTHRWRRFVRPEELEAMCKQARLTCLTRIGEAPRLLATLRRRTVVLRPSRSLAVGYAALFQKVHP